MMKKISLLIFGLSIVAIFNVQQVFAAECPQPRQTKAAPADIAGLKNPKTSAEDIAAGKELFLKKAKPVVCVMCHGATGAGDGKIGKAFKSPKAPRNFTCKETMKDISPGQMFYTVKNGSPGTGMAAHKKTLSDDQIWQIIAFINTEFNN